MTRSFQARPHPRQAGQGACRLPTADLYGAAELTVREMLCYTAELKSPPGVSCPASSHPMQRVSREGWQPRALPVPATTRDSAEAQPAALREGLVAGQRALPCGAAAAERARRAGRPGSPEAVGGPAPAAALPGRLRLQRAPPGRAGVPQQAGSWAALGLVDARRAGCHASPAAAPSCTRRPASHGPDGRCLRLEWPVWELAALAAGQQPVVRACRPNMRAWRRPWSARLQTWLWPW